MMYTAATLTTAAEFEKICHELGPCELVRGEVVALSPGGLRHNRIGFKIGMMIEHWASESKRGRVYVGETGLIVETNPDTVRALKGMGYRLDRRGTFCSVQAILRGKDGELQGFGDLRRGGFAKGF